MPTLTKREINYSVKMHPKDRRVLADDANEEGEVEEENEEGTDTKLKRNTKDSCSKI